MRTLAFLLLGLALTLLLITVYPLRPSIENRAVARTVHPITKVGDIFRRH
jgi:hypothetical protein